MRNPCRSGRTSIHTENLSCRTNWKSSWGPSSATINQISGSCGDCFIELNETRRKRRNAPSTCRHEGTSGRCRGIEPCSAIRGGDGAGKTDVGCRSTRTSKGGRRSNRCNPAASSGNVNRGINSRMRNTDATSCINPIKRSHRISVERPLCTCRRKSGQSRRVVNEE